MAFIHIFWSILNLVLLVGTFVVSYRNYRTFSERFGWLPSGLLIVVLVSTYSSSNDSWKDRKAVGTFSKTVYLPDHQLTESIDRTFTLYDGGVSKVTQQLNVYPANHPDSIRISGAVFPTGLVMGIQWTAVSTSAELLPDRRIRYQSTGTLQWRLLSLPVYSDYKAFTGTIKLGKP